MENILKILKASFQMLLDRPKIFAPKIFSAAFSSLLLIGVVTRSITLVQMLILLPISSLLGTITPVMVSSMVKNSNEKALIIKGLKDTWKNWPGILALFGITILISAVIAVVSLPGILAYIATGEILYLFISGILILGLTLTASFFMYFMPIAIIGHEKVGTSMSNAFSTSRENKGEVMALTIFSFSLLLVASASSSFLKELSLIGFSAGRIISSIVGTYILVVSPHYYLEHQERAANES